MRLYFQSLTATTYTTNNAFRLDSLGNDAQQPFQTRQCEHSRAGRDAGRRAERRWMSSLPSAAWVTVCIQVTINRGDKTAVISIGSVVMVLRLKV